MAGGTKVFNIPTNWESFKLSVTTSSQEVTSPSSIPNISTIMIQADSTNTDSIFFGATSSVASTGANAGGELTAGQSATLPLSTDDGSQLYVVSGAGSQDLYVSIYNGGNIC